MFFFVITVKKKLHQKMTGERILNRKEPIIAKTDDQFWKIETSVFFFFSKYT